MKKRRIWLTLFIMTLTSCENVERLTHVVPGEFVNDEYVFPMNTLTQLKMYYKSQYDEVVDGFDEIIIRLSKEVDRYHDYSSINNLKTINDSCGTDEAISISDHLFELIKLGVQLTKITKGKFNIAMGSIIDLYAPYLEEGNTNVYKDFPVSDLLIQQALQAIPTYEEIDNYVFLNEENKTVTLKMYHNEKIILSFGAIAKGFILQKAYDYLDAFRYPSLLDAGSSTMATIGNNPTNKEKDWRITFRGPSLENSNDFLCTVQLKGDYFISTSGDYQQNFIYFDEHGNTKLMHHILDATTGVSNNYLRSVSLISKNTSLAVLDALSTAMFNYQTLEEILELIDIVEKEFFCDISFVLARPVYNETGQINLNEYNIDVSNSFEQLVTSNYSENVKEINKIKNY